MGFAFCVDGKLTRINCLLSHFSKDVRLPVQLQRAMAAEAEAAREARAKVRSVPRDYEIFFCATKREKERGRKS